MTAIVLAGGKSSRMRRDKALLELGGETMIGRIIKLLSPLFKEVIIVTNSPRKYSRFKARVVKDVSPGKGPLMGLYSGLKASKHTCNFLIACDTPLLNTELIEYMKENAKSYDAVVPVCDGRAQPLFAIYSRKCLGAAKRGLDSGALKMQIFLEHLKVRYLAEEQTKRFDPNGTCFLNVNTQEDYRKAQTAFEDGSSCQARDLTIERLSPGKRSKIEDLAVRETALTVLVNGQAVATLPCSPYKLEHLAVGFLLAEGVVTNAKQIKSVALRNEKRLRVDVELAGKLNLPNDFFYRRLIGSGCGRVSAFFTPLERKGEKAVAGGMKVSAESIIKLVSDLQEMSVLYRKTGGVHSAALCTAQGIAVFAEDIGRHNAFDKIFGECLVKGISTDDKLMVTSGRISSEIVTKVIRRKTPLVVSRAAATDLAVEMAEKAGVTLVGFVRGRRMNIYTHGYRISS